MAHTNLYGTGHRLYQDLEERADLLNPSEMGLATRLVQEAVMDNFNYLRHLQGEGKINQELSIWDLLKTARENVERNYIKDKATTKKETITIFPQEKEEPGQWVAEGGRVGFSTGGVVALIPGSSI